MITFISDPYIIDPLGIAYLSAMLKQAGGKDIRLTLTPQLQTKGVKTPIMAFSVTTGKHRHYAQVARLIKEKHPNLTSLFGGPHCTFFPDFVFTEGVDYIIRGEGFNPIVQFVKSFNTSKVTETDGLCYLKGEETKVAHSNDLAQPIKVADLPFPDRDLIYQFPKNRDNPICNVMTTHGCPCNCSYCYNQQFRELGYPPRTRPVDSVIEETEELITNYPSKEMIFFQDDIFPIFRGGWVEAFCREWRARIRKPFHIQVRIDMLKEDSLSMLADAGLHGVTFAAETANTTARRELLRRDISDEAIYYGAALLRHYGIKFRIENMIGIPGETVASALATLRMNIKCKPTIGWASIFQPYPGTDLGNRCFDDGMVATDIEEWGGDFFTSAPLHNHQNRRLERIQKLFSLVCDRPFLYRFLPLLSRLPFSYKGTYRRVKQKLYDKGLYKLD